MDLYLPALPALTDELGTSDVLVQATLSACMVGLALGQIVIGPLSDRVGRRLPLMVGVALFSLTSLACVIAPDVGWLIFFRFVQGAAGSAGIVLSRAIVRDAYDTKDVAVVYSRLMIVTGAAPVVAPVLGGLLLLVLDWRGLFVVLAMVGGILLLCTWRWVPESLPQARRNAGGIRAQFRIVGSLAFDTRFLCYALAGGFAGCGLFSYISMSPLIVQVDYELTSVGFALVFAVNSIGIVVVSQVNAALARRLDLRRLATAGVLMGMVASSAVIIASTGASIVGLLIPLFFAVAAQGLIAPNVMALALAPMRTSAGAGSAWVGGLQFLIGALVPPLVSTVAVTALVLGVTMTGSFLVALLFLVLAVRLRGPVPRAGFRGTAA